MLSSNQWIRIQSNFGLRSTVSDQMVRWLKESYSILCELIRPGAKLTKRALESG